MDQKAVVPIKSAFASCTNITVAATILLTTLNDVAPLIPEGPVKKYVNMAIIIIGGGLAIYYRTFKTASVTPSVASKPEVPTFTTEEMATAMLNLREVGKSR